MESQKQGVFGKLKKENPFSTKRGVEDRLGKLYSYIKSALVHHSKEEVEEKLTKHGWPKSHVDEVFQRLRQAAKEGSGKVRETFKKAEKVSGSKLIETYSFDSDNIPVTVFIYQNKGDFVPTYEVEVQNISRGTRIILDKIREELISEVSIGSVDTGELKSKEAIRKKFERVVKSLIEKYFISLDDDTKEFLTSYLIQRCFGLGKLELLMTDSNLEEIAINNAHEPVWVYHKTHGWLKTNITVDNEKLIKHYASTIAREEGKAVTILEPLLDARLSSGDRVNATLNPISVRGNTITLRKFATKPWTITDLIKNKTISSEAAALIWTAVQYELSSIITGGTASGKTSLLNVLSSFFPPNQRIISIEDTRELRLPNFLHWVPMITRMPNPEGKGGINMLDLLVNSLRQRPDRIVVGEIRRKQEAEVLLEAIHTGHSVYGTLHANDAEEFVTRLTNPPIDLPKAMIPAISLVVVANRNRRTGKRRLSQLAEILPDGTANVIGQQDIREDKFKLDMDKSKVLLKDFDKYIGISKKELLMEIHDKAMVLDWLVKQNINDVDKVGYTLARYYTDKAEVMKEISSSHI